MRSSFCLFLLLAGCSANIDDRPRNAIAVERQNGDVEIYIADGPQSCESPDVTMVLGPGCDAPSWQFAFLIPVEMADRPTLDFGAGGVGFTFGMQQGECHSGEPMVNSGTVQLGARDSNTIAFDLQVDVQSSVNPSGSYRADVCD